MNRPLEKILLAEDEPDIQEVARIALESVGGFVLKICESGQQAIDASTEFEPDLLLLDVMMPGMDGPTAFQQIRKISGMESIPVIFMTAKVQAQEQAHYRDLGAMHVISKPFDPMQLSDTIRRVWEKHEE